MTVSASSYVRTAGAALAGVVLVRTAELLLVTVDEVEDCPLLITLDDDKLDCELVEEAVLLVEDLLLVKEFTK